MIKPASYAGLIPAAVGFRSRQQLRWS